ncbi:ArsR/SmtB family transcription factor [Brevibacillus sp. SYSU BS000544]|uniref:ArsR/SmtB family transcription factor n=1 Tax=Brevibacillus sp. SYSU BS000544 TaxID=3416443 RepID=UPI003CE57E11
MNILDITHGRSTYHIQLTHSLLFESALGIAAITYPDIHPTLGKTTLYWEEILAGLSEELRSELDTCQRHNTWKTLLQFLHQGNFADIHSFVTYIQSLSEQQLRYYALPYIGTAFQEIRQKASEGDSEAIGVMTEHCRDHKFFADYIPYVSQVDANLLRTHLINLISGWYNEFLSAQEAIIHGMLKRDLDQKQRMLNSLSPEEFVTWATGGFVYLPEPTVTRVLLIPHYIYRPWTIQAEMEGTKILYYPISDESLDVHQDPYHPPLTLVQRYKALGDETRLRLIKLLYEKDRTLNELTDLVDSAKSTIHHHLTMLKSAYIVEGKGNSYRLNRSSLSLMGHELTHFLDQENVL